MRAFDIEAVRVDELSIVAIRRRIQHAGLGRNGDTVSVGVDVRSSSFDGVRVAQRGMALRSILRGLDGRARWPVLTR
jgi:hypothetical protein